MREFVLGLIDALRIGVVVVFVMNATGYLPIPEHQQKAEALFGQCIGSAPCPASCVKNLGGVQANCNVPLGSIKPICAGWCGVCAHNTPACFGVNDLNGGACSCGFGCP